MKKIFLASLFICFIFKGYSQFYLGGQFAYNNTWLLNKQVFAEGPEMDVAASFGNYYGLIAGYYFSGDVVGLELNMNVNKVTQKYIGDFKLISITNSDERAYYNSSLVLNTIDFPILLKLGKLVYFEIGGIFSLVNKAIYNKTFEEDYSYRIGIYKDIPLYNDFKNVENLDVKYAFKDLGIGAVVGFGANINLIEDALKFNLGLRCNFIITDLEGVNALGYTKDTKFWVTEKETKTFKTNPLYLGLKAGLIYEF
ncbi:MAG TPA: hypothetical protein PLG05_05320 [Bacteroidales bacterium]|nr:hypothetical protein [Bacteroidales bacterium]HOR60128.1 hypothetical protein [Bacteroidales bacterium]HPL04577.1 hypothetical protein [Bacteroidales bacterium]